MIFFVLIKMLYKNVYLYKNVCNLCNVVEIREHASFMNLKVHMRG